MKEVCSAVQTEGRCPNCDYDLRGLVEPRCPECGQAFTSREVAVYARRRWPLRRFFRILLLATIPWFIAYVFVDEIRGTVDRVEVNWLTGPFLLFPLQLLLAAAAAGTLEARAERSVKRFGARLTVILWALILGHTAITVLTL